MFFMEFELRGDMAWLQGLTKGEWTLLEQGDLADLLFEHFFKGVPVRDLLSPSNSGGSVHATP